MDSYRHELLRTLINKLRLDDSSKCFQGGQLTALVIHNRSDRWSFYLGLNEVIPYQTFLKFNKCLKSVFSVAKSFDVVVRTQSTKVNYDAVKDYWPWVVRHCGLSKVMADQLIKYGHLRIVSDRAVIDTKNEALRGFLINGVLVQIEDCYHQLGFPRFRIRVLGGTTKLPAKIVNFEIKKNASDVKLARQAVNDLNSASIK